MIYAPNPYEILFPFDHIGVIASEDQLDQFLPEFDIKIDISDIYTKVEDIVIEKHLIEEDSPLNGKEIKDSGIREKSDALIVGIERDSQHFLNPSSNTIFETNDIVWIVGERQKLQKLNFLK